MLQGTAASPGIAIGEVYILKDEGLIIDQNVLPAERREEELQLFEDSVATTSGQIRKLIAAVNEEMGQEKAAIFEAHLLMLQDEVFLNEVRTKIRQEAIGAAYALKQVVDKYYDQFMKIEDEYLKERAADLKDIGQRLTKNILGLETRSLSDLEGEYIIIAGDLTPSDTAQLKKSKVKAFAIDMGGRTSHTAIMARSLEIPAVVGLGKISERARPGDVAIVDGNGGGVILNPDEATLKHYRDLQECYLQDICALEELKGKPCLTNCGNRRVELAANIGCPADCEGALQHGAEGSGLYRTEFLYMQRETLPSEEEQFLAYKSVAEQLSPHPVIIRTLDIGGDKKLPYLNLPPEMNPFLGCRAIRLCLGRPDIFKVQLRAILRASVYGRVRIMYPMISGLEELRKANGVLEEVKGELRRKGVAFDPQLKVGIMIEIPAAALIADSLIKEADFFSIGTNDLVQYTLAVDRMNERISHLYDPLHPGVLGLIKNVIDASHRAGKWTGMCGEMAGDPLMAPLLLGMGLDEFSMSAISIARVKKVIKALSYDQAKAIAEQALSITNPEEIRELLRKALENSV